MSGLILDLIVIAFIALTAFVFMKKGFVMALYSFVSLFISFVAGALLKAALFWFFIKTGIINPSTNPVTVLIVDIVLYLVISVGIAIALFILGRVLNIFSKLPLIGTVNSLLGAVLGLLLGVLVCGIVFSIIGIAESRVSIENVLTLIKDSRISKIFYENNLFLILQ